MIRGNFFVPKPTEEREPLLRPTRVEWQIGIKLLEEFPGLDGPHQGSIPIQGCHGRRKYAVHRRRNPPKQLSVQFQR